VSLGHFNTHTAFSTSSGEKDKAEGDKRSNHEEHSRQELLLRNLLLRPSDPLCRASIIRRPPGDPTMLKGSRHEGESDEGWQQPEPRGDADMPVERSKPVHSPLEVGETLRRGAVGGWSWGGLGGEGAGVSFRPAVDVEGYDLCLGGVVVGHLDPRLAHRTRGIVSMHAQPLVEASPAVDMAAYGGDWLGRERKADIAHKGILPVPIRVRVPLRLARAGLVLGRRGVGGGLVARVWGGMVPIARRRCPHGPAV